MRKLVTFGLASLPVLAGWGLVSFASGEGSTTQTAPPKISPPRQSQLPLTSSFATMLSRIESERRLPGIWGCFSQNGNLSRTVASGYSDVEGQLASSATDIVSYGSISKVFAGTLICILAELKIINMNAKVKDILPDLANTSGSSVTDATFIDLITHKSGLGEFVAPQGLLFDAKDPSQKRLAFAGHLLRTSKIVGPPGSTQHYSAGVDIAIPMVERITGKSYEELLDLYICIPFQLESVSVGPKRPVNWVTGYKTDRFIIPGSVYAYQPSRAVSENVHAFAAASAICGTVTDLAHFTSQLANGRCLGSSPVSQSAFELIYRFPEGSSYALSGFSGNSRHMSHSGGTNRGDSAVCFFNRDLKVSGAVYTNVAQTGLVGLLDQSLYDWFVNSSRK